MRHIFIIIKDICIIPLKEAAISRTARTFRFNSRLTLFHHLRVWQRSSILSDCIFHGFRIQVIERNIIRTSTIFIFCYSVYRFHHLIEWRTPAIKAFTGNFRGFRSYSGSAKMHLLRLPDLIPISIQEANGISRHGRSSPKREIICSSKRPNLIFFIWPRAIQKNSQIFWLHISFCNITISIIVQINFITIANIAFCFEFFQFIQIHGIGKFTIIFKITNGANIIITIMEIRSYLRFDAQAITGQITKKITDLTLASALIEFIFNRTHKVIIFHD